MDNNSVSETVPVGLRAGSNPRPTSSYDAVIHAPEVMQWNGTPSLSDMVKIKTRENNKLRAEKEFLYKVQQLGESLRAEVEYVTQRLQLAVEEFRKVRRNLTR
jgi:hypothetical protein